MSRLQSRSRGCAIRMIIAPIGGKYMKTDTISTEELFKIMFGVPRDTCTHTFQELILVMGIEYSQMQTKIEMLEKQLKVYEAR